MVDDKEGSYRLLRTYRVDKPCGMRRATRVNLSLSSFLLILNSVYKRIYIFVKEHV